MNGGEGGGWKFEPTDPGCGLKTYIGEAIGAASMCWEDVSGAGEFQSERAGTIVDAIYERAMAPDGARLGMATTEQLFAELQARLDRDSPSRAHTLGLMKKNLRPEILNYRTVG